MEAKEITDKQYIPLGKLELMDSDIFAATKEYRKNNMKIIAFANEYSKLVETPELLKNRYIKNVEISRKIEIEATDNDLILEIAKELILKKQRIEIPKDVLNNLLKLYKEEGNDLTIVTTWLINNIDEYLKEVETSGEKEDISRIMPEITGKDKQFILKANNTNAYYSINDYIEETGCSYETARSGLERLTKLKLFLKKKQGKKFVYQPLTALKQLLKGGS